MMLVLRVLWVFAFRDIDSDAYGHFFIATAVKDDPTNLAVHWVWLPLYHFFVAALTYAGVGFRGVRIVNAGVATIAPFLLHDAVRRRTEDADIARASAIALALSPLATVLAQSAQPETLFLAAICFTLFESARGHDARAGVFLAIACMLRYEAWGATLALAVCWLLGKLRRAPSNAAATNERIGFAFVAIPCAVVTAYVLFRFWTDGQLLLFFRGTRDITARQVASRWTFYDVVSFPIIMPYMIFGPLIALIPVGWRTVVRWNRPRDWVLALGFAVFLLLSYYGGGSHAGERYLASLVPFGCIALGAGVVRVTRRAKGRLARHLEVGLMTVLALTTAWHLRRAARMAIPWDEDLRQRQERVEHHLPPTAQMR